MEIRFNTTAAIGSLLLLTSLSGCANFLGGPQKAPGRDLSNQDGSGLSYNPEDYNCPYESNVVPDYNWMLDGSGFYEVCTHNENANDIMIHGETYFSDQICVFPAEVIDSTGQIFLKQDIAHNSILYKCVRAEDGGAPVRFDFTNYNAFFIVEQPNFNQMLSCLTAPGGPNYYACPNTSGSGYYSYGRFRQ